MNYIYGPPEILTHPDVATGKIQAIPILSFYPLDDVDASARAVGEHWLRHPEQSPALSVGGWFGAEAFMLNGVQEDGRNFGTDEHKWQTGVLSRVFAIARLKAAALVWQSMGAPMPTLVHWDAEFNSTAEPKAQGPYNKLKCDYLNSCLKGSEINASVKTLVVEFTQFASNTSNFVCNGDGVAQVVSPVRPRCKSSTQMYSLRSDKTSNPLLLPKFAAWCQGVAAGGYPFMDAMNSDNTAAMLRLCRRYGHNPVFYIDRDWPASVDNQVSWASDAIDGSKQ